MALPTFHVYIRDRFFALVDELDNWISLQCVVRRNKVGSLTLEMSAQSALAGIMFERMGVVVTRDDVTVFSGQFVEFERTTTTIRATAEDDMAILDTPGRANPAQSSGPYTVPYDVRTGTASTIIRQLVDVNIGPSAPAPWKIAAITLAADPVLGGTVTSRVNGDSLLTYMAELAVSDLAGGLAFRLQQTNAGANTLTFSVTAPRDQRGEVKFGIDYGTAADVQDTWQREPANYYIVAGDDGFGQDRTVVEGETDPTLVALAGRLIAKYAFQPGTSSPSELNQRLAELIAGAAPQRKTAVTPIDVPSLTYGTHWDLGDLVTVVVNGQDRSGVIQEITINLDPVNGPTITPLIGDPNATDDDSAARQIAAVDARLETWQRNFGIPDDSITDAMLHPFMKWSVGDLRLTARSVAQAGWLLCQGQAVGRATYALLFAAIGTTFGAGDGSTTFNVPDLRGRFPLGAGGSYALGSTGGATTAAGLPHTHPHSHGGGNLAYAHTHPGNHSHGIGSHTHTIAHMHTVDIDHNHAAFSSGGVNVDTVAVGTASLGSGTSDHHHNVDVPALGTTNKTTSGSSAGNSGGSGGTTDPDSNAFAVGAGATWSGGTDPDSSAASYTGSVSTLNPYTVVTYEIFAGVS